MNEDRILTLAFKKEPLLDSEREEMACYYKQRDAIRVFTGSISEERVREILEEIENGTYSMKGNESCGH